jgi:hypothetical protein
MDALGLTIGILIAIVIIVFLLGSAFSSSCSEKIDSTQYSQQDLAAGDGDGGEGGDREGQ